MERFSFGAIHFQLYHISIRVSTTDETHMNLLAETEVVCYLQAAEDNLAPQ